MRVCTERVGPPSVLDVVATLAADALRNPASEDADEPDKAGCGSVPEREVIVALVGFKIIDFRPLVVCEPIRDLVEKTLASFIEYLTSAVTDETEG